MTTFPLNLLYGLWCGGFLAACAGPRLPELGALGALGALGESLGKPSPKPGPRSGRRSGRQRGGALALAAWRRLLVLPGLFALLSVLPAATYIAAQFPDWSLMYLIDPQRLPRLWTLAAGLLAGAGVMGGFAAGVIWFERSGGVPLKLALGGLLLVYLGFVFLSWRAGRLSAVGSFANFHAGGWLMRPLVSFSRLSVQLETAPLGLLYALIATNLCEGIALYLVARTLLTKSEFIFAAAPAQGA